MTFRMLTSEDLMALAEADMRAVGLDKVTFTSQRGGVAINKTHEYEEFGEAFEKVEFIGIESHDNESA